MKLTDDQIIREATKLANEIEAICRGRPTASVYMALSMMLGASAAHAPKPDFEGMMTLVERSAFGAFRRALEARS